MLRLCGDSNVPHDVISLPPCLEPTPRVCPLHPSKPRPTLHLKISFHPFFPYHTSSAFGTAHPINKYTQSNAVMEAIKNAIGLGTTADQQGREPVSGVTGSGTAGEPYDQGNAEGTFAFLPWAACMRRSNANEWLRAQRRRKSTSADW